MAETTANTEAPGGHSAFPPFQTENFPSQLVWLAMSFTLLYVLMAKVALPRIGSILAERSKRHRRRTGGRGTLQGAVGRRACGLREVARRRARPRPRHRRRNAGAAGAEAEEMNKKLEAELHEKLAAAEQSIARPAAPPWAMCARSPPTPLRRLSSG